MLAPAHTVCCPVTEVTVGNVLIVIANVEITLPHPLAPVTATFPDEAIEV